MKPLNMQIILFVINNSQNHSFLFDLLIYYFSYFLILCFIVRKWNIRQQLSKLRWIFQVRYGIIQLFRTTDFLYEKQARLLCNPRFQPNFRARKWHELGAHSFRRPLHNFIADSTQQDRLNTVISKSQLSSIIPMVYSSFLDHSNCTTLWQQRGKSIFQKFDTISTATNCRLYQLRTSP